MGDLELQVEIKHSKSDQEGGYEIVSIVFLNKKKTDPLFGVFDYSIFGSFKINDRYLYTRGWRAHDAGII